MLETKYTLEIYDCLERFFQFARTKTRVSFNIHKAKHFLRLTTYFEETRRFVARKILLRYIYRAEIFHREQISLQS